MGEQKARSTSLLETHNPVFSLQTEANFQTHSMLTERDI